jgi:hypothetical protein
MSFNVILRHIYYMSIRCWQIYDIDGSCHLMSFYVILCHLCISDSYIYLKFGGLPSAECRKVSWYWDPILYVAVRSWRSTFWIMSFYVILCHFMSFMYFIIIYIHKISRPNISRVPDGQLGFWLDCARSGSILLVNILDHVILRHFMSFYVIFVFHIHIYS